MGHCSNKPIAPWPGILAFIEVFFEYPKLANLAWTSYFLVHAPAGICRSSRLKQVRLLLWTP
jgi:hypothetical protein